MSESRRQMPESRVQSPEKEIQKPSDFCPLPSVFWFTASVLFCLLGMASKEVMVSAPLMVLLYDRTFVGGTFREAWRRRWPFYAALAGTWLLLGYLVAGIGGTRGHAAGFGLGVTPWTYALTQCRAILHYLKLSVWPDRLTLDYGTGVTRHLADVLPQALALVSLVLATILGLYRRPVLGFVGAWFFAILAPSSSFLPLVTQTVAEHRMYLPLASVILLAVLGLYLWLGRRSAVIFLALAVGLGCLTERRNNDYRNNLTLWSDTVAKCPGNERAHTHLGLELLAIPGRLPDAIAEFRKALQINPDYADAHNDLGNALATLPGGLPDAISHFEAALRLSPDLAGAHNNLGNALLKIPGRLPDAISHFETALRLKPDFAGAHNSLGNALTAVPGRLPDAISHFERALQLEPDFAEAHSNLGNALLRLPGRVPDAIAQYEAALRIDPSLVETHYNLGNARLQQGNYPAAYEQFEDALKLKPDFAKGHLNLGVTLVKMGRLNDAIAQFETAQQIDPGDPSARRDLEIVQKSLPKDGDENGPRRPAP
jgi:tetratricopeptide (TPR) repeat protein